MKTIRIFILFDHYIRTKRKREREKKTENFQNDVINTKPNGT